ncbi:putative hydrolase [Mariniblastus fucicola]|uniref:Putative hydrolase n=1 Tax=Mariniblastus fucicola TaxID=980251 RepID=A0A5B9P6H4_9BACT|nr:putative hydrolase [Mariniblastus fucicola]
MFSDLEGRSVISSLATTTIPDYDFGMLIAEFPPFRPDTWLANCHMQTILPLFKRGKRVVYSATKHIVHLRDGDRLVVHDDKPKDWITGDRIVILLHGLVGCHGSPYVVRCADKLTRHGIRTIRVDMRGFGDSTLISHSHLHGGCSPDLDDVIDSVHRHSPLSKISVVGFSIGGNIALKAAGEWGDHPHPNVDSIFAVSPPVDLERTSWNLRQFGNRIYELYFMRRLKSHLALRRRKVKGLKDNGLNPLPDRLLQFDDEFVAPVLGYSGAREYYKVCSSGPQLKNITVPTIILTSEDDPIVPFDIYSDFDFSTYVNLVSTKHGGHLGFLGKSIRDPDSHWMDWRIANSIVALDD